MYSLFNVSFSLFQLIVISCLFIAFVVQLIYYTCCYSKLLTYWNSIKKGEVYFSEVKFTDFILDIINVLTLLSFVS